MTDTANTANREAWLNAVTDDIYTLVYETARPDVVLSVGAAPGRRKPRLVDVVAPAQSADAQTWHVFTSPEAGPERSADTVEMLIASLPGAALVAVEDRRDAALALVEVHGAMPTIACTGRAAPKQTTRGVKLACGCGFHFRISRKQLAAIQPDAFCPTACGGRFRDMHANGQPLFVNI